MKIYLLIETPILGELSGKTVMNERVVCNSCGRLSIQYESIEYKFDRWNGEDLITGLTQLFISDRLAKGLESNGLSGFTLAEISTLTGENFKKGEGLYTSSIPSFYHLKINGEIEGFEMWWKKMSQCKSCGKYKWKPTKEGIRSKLGPSLTGRSKDISNPLPRNVYIDSWNGDDIFVQKPAINTPFVTQKFVDVLNKLGIKINQKGGVWLSETNWIDREGNIIKI